MTRRIRFTPFLSTGVFACGVAFAGAHPGAAEPVAFATRPPISSSAAGARSVVAADVDGDGDLDVISASAGDNKIAWYENAARDGSAWVTHTLATTPAPWHVTAADVDRDGDIDVVVAAPGDTKLAWYENAAGNGTAWTLHTIVTTATLGMRAVATGDFDRDARLDVLAASDDDATLSWYGNTAGNGTVWARGTIALASAWALAAADLDGDGDTDVVSVSSDRATLSWHENRRQFDTLWPRFTVATSLGGANAVASADLDGDGDLDLLAAATFDSTLRWYENSAGDASAWSLRTVATGVNGVATVFAADLDADGDLDVLTASQSDDSVLWFENLAGDGSAWTRHTIATGVDNPLSVFAADIDRDGDLDVMSASVLDNRVAWYRNDTIHRSACFVQRSALSSVPFSAGGLAATDIDHDGDIDVAAGARTAASIVWYANSGDGAAWTAATVPIASAGVPRLVGADMDGDGDTDLVSMGPDMLWQENVGGAGASWLSHTIATNIIYPRDLEVGDIDRDGDLDVFAATPYRFGLAWHENTLGNGTTWALHRLGGYNVRSVALGDIDGDGDLDVVTSDYSAMLDFKPNWHENPSWVRHPLYFVGPYDPHDVVADVDADGDVDVVTSVRIWYESGAPSGLVWTPRTYTTQFVNAPEVVAADLDADGDVDVVSTGADTAWYEKVPVVATPWPRHTLPASTDANSAAAADVDGDGDLDLVFAFASAVGWYENRGGQAAFVTTDATPPAAINGQLAPMLRLEVTHLGRPGDSDLELASLGLLFEASPGVPLTTAQANNLVETLRIYRDANGNGVFDPASDVLVLNVDTLALAGGVQAVPFADGDPNVQVAQGVPRTYFVVVQLTADASTQTPNQFRVTHLLAGGAASQVEDRAYDIPLHVACPADFASAILGPVTPVELLGFSLE